MRHSSSYANRRSTNDWIQPLGMETPVIRFLCWKTSDLSVYIYSAAQARMLSYLNLCFECIWISSLYSTYRVQRVAFPSDPQEKAYFGLFRYGLPGDANAVRSYPWTLNMSSCSCFLTPLLKTKRNLEFDAVQLHTSLQTIYALEEAWDNERYYDICKTA